MGSVLKDARAQDFGAPKSENKIIEIKWHTVRAYVCGRKMAIITDYETGVFVLFFLVCIAYCKLCYIVIA